MRRHASIAMIILLAAPGCKKQSDIDRALVESFTCFQKNEVLGVPDGKMLNLIGPYISKSLTHMLEAADRVEDEYYQQQTEPAPPLSEGWNLFFGVYEGATSFKVLKSSSKGEKGKAVMEFTLQETADAKPDIWQRSISVVKESGRWVIDDVIDVKASDSQAPDSLRTQLNRFIQTKGGTVEKGQQP